MLYKFECFQDSTNLATNDSSIGGRAVSLQAPKTWNWANSKFANLENHDKTWKNFEVGLVTWKNLIWIPSFLIQIPSCSKLFKDIQSLNLEFAQFQVSEACSLITP